jgi:hypothetical protein
VISPVWRRRSLPPLKRSICTLRIIQKLKSENESVRIRPQPGHLHFQKYHPPFCRCASNCSNKSNGFEKLILLALGSHTYLPLDGELMYLNVEGLHRNARQGRLDQPARKGGTAALITFAQQTRSPVSGLCRSSFWSKLRYTVRTAGFEC